MLVPTNTIDLANHRIFARDLDGSKAEKRGYARNRTFLVSLDPDEAAKLEAEGWPVKYREPNEEGDEGIYFLKVEVKFGKIPPKVVVLNPFTKRKKALNERTIESLNWISIQDIPLMDIRAFKWEKAGKEGVKCYLNSMYVTKRVDPFEEKFSDYVDEDSDAEDDYD